MLSSMSRPNDISRARRAALLVGALALLTSVLVVAVHLGTVDHCGLEGPDHQCDLCRAVDGNPPLATTQFDLPLLQAVTVVEALPAPSPHEADHPLARGRAPPVTVHVT